MSEYVEARYALLTLQAARETSQERAAHLLDDLLNDLGSTNSDKTNPRATLVGALRHLTLMLHDQRMPPSSYWQEAYQAARAWCETTE